jgi:xanthine dehydrogenase accessory factor
MFHGHEIFEKLAELAVNGQPFATVTVIGSVGSIPGNVGSKLIVNESGLLFGTVGGGRVEARAIEHAQCLLVPESSKKCELVEWNLQRDIQMTCGGVVTLLFEAHNVASWRVVIFGAGHIAQSLVRLLLLLDCRVVCIDSRMEWLARLPTSPKLCIEMLGEPREFVDHLRPSDYVLCMTMGHSTDRPIIQRILEKECVLQRNVNGGVAPRPFLQLPYLGVVGSLAKRKIVLHELLAAGVPLQLAEQIHCPVGLPLGTNHPGEISVSVAAELIQVRDNVRKGMAGACKSGDGLEAHP